MTETLANQLDISPEDIRRRARFIVITGIVVGCALIGLDHSLTAFLPAETLPSLPIIASLGGLLLMITVSVALMRTLGELTDEALLKRVKQANGALAESEERYRGLFETSPDAMIYRRKGADGTMQLLDVNDAYLNLFGYDRSEVTPNIASGQRLTPESRKRWHDVYTPALERDGFVDAMVLDGLRTDGTSFPATAKIFGIRDDAGEIVATWTTLRDMSIQELTERKTQESKEQFRLLFESNRDGLISWQINADGSYELATFNEAFRKMFGLGQNPDPDALTQGFHVTQKSRDTWNTTFREQLVRDDFVEDFSLEGQLADGTRFPVRGNAWQVKGPDGERNAVWICFRDVSDQVRAEQGLKIKDRAIEQSSVAISITDLSNPATPSTYVNPAYEKMMGFCASDFDGQGAFGGNQTVKFIAETDAHQADLDRAIASAKDGTHYHGRLWSLTKDGQRILRDIDSSPIRNANGGVTHWVTVSQDVTQKVEDEQQLKLFKRAVEQASNSIAILEQTDDGVKSAYVNPAFEQMTGFTLASLRKRTEDFHATPAGKPDNQEQFKSGFKTGTAVHGRRWATNSDGTAQLRDIQNSPVRDENGTVTHWISVTRDITKEVEAEQELHLFKRAMEQSPTAITIVEEQGDDIPRVAFVNESIERIHGFSTGEITGQSASLFVSEGRISSELANSMKEARIRDEAIDTNGYFKKPDGSDGWLFLRYAPVRDASDTITHWISYGADITEQHNAERSLRRNAAILEQLTDTVFLSGLDGVIIDCNQVSEKTLGRSREALIGHKLSSFSPDPEETNRRARTDSDKALTSEGFTNEVSLTREDGQNILLECSTKLLLNDRDEPEGWITVGRDITEKRAAEEELRVLKRAMEQSPTAIIIVKTEQTERPRIAFANPALKDMHGINPDDILGQDTRAISAKAGFEDGLSARIRDARHRGEAIDTDGYFRRRDGSDGRLSLRYAPVRNDEQDITHWISYGNDITEQFDAAKIQRRNSLILGQLSESLFIADMNGHTIDCNTASEKTLGRNREGILGHRLSDFSPTPKIQNARIHDSHAAIQEHVEFVDEIPVLRHDGQEILLETTSKRWLGNDGQPEGWITIGRDITEKRAAEKELRILKRAIEQSPSSITISEVQEKRAPRIIFNNEAVLTMHGQASGATVGQEASAFVTSHMIADDLGQRLTAARLRGEAIDTAGKYYRADGTEGWLNARYAPVRDEQNEITHWIAFGTDITEQHQAEQQRRILERALEYSPTAVSIIETMPDKILQNSYVNGAFEKMTGYARGDIINQPYSPLSAKPSSDKDGFLARNSRESTEGIDQRVRADGSTYMREFRSAAVQNEQGETTHYIVLNNDITERIESERLMQKLQSAFDQTDRAMSIMDVDEDGHKIAYVNPAFEAMTGYSAEELEGKPAGYVENRDTAGAEVIREWRRSVQSNKSTSLTVETKRKDGSWFSRDIQVDPVRDENGETFSWVEISQDVTQKLEDEQRLRSLQIAFDQADSAISIMTVTETGNRIAFVNGAYEKMMGYTRDEVIGTTAGFLKNRDFHEPNVMDTWVNSVRQGQAVSLTLETQRKDGAWFVREVESNPVRDSEGSVVSWISVSRDVTQKLKDAQRLRRDALILENLGDSVVFTNADEIVLECNASALKMFGRTEDELVGQPISAFVVDKDSFARDFPARTALAAKNKILESEIVLRKGNGDHALAEYASVPWKSADGSFLGYVTVSRDITEKRALEDQLQHAQKMEAVGQLTGGIAHDFNNLMGVISGSLQLIEAEDEDWGFIHKMAHTANKSVMRGRDLVDRMLSFSRRQNLDPVETDIAELMEGTVDLLRRSIGDNINVTLEFDANLARCVIDQAQLESAILNMSLNARDAMEPGGHLSIAARNASVTEIEEDQAIGEHHYVCVSIQDDGTGMDEGTLAKIYEPFFTTKDIGEGSGLGLSMVYGFVKQSGGHINVESVPGEGTTFSLFFPVAANESSAHEKQITQTQEKNKTKQLGRILVVEDNPDMLEVTQHSLGRMGYDVVTATSGSSAMTQLSENPDVKIAFIDIMLPDGMTGTELAKMLLSVRSDLRVLFTSGYSDPAILKDAADISQVIRKPFNLGELKDALEGLMEGSKTLH